jgi:hypothetical protein
MGTSVEGEIGIHLDDGTPENENENEKPLRSEEQVNYLRDFGAQSCFTKTQTVPIKGLHESPLSLNIPVRCIASVRA